MKKFIDLLEQHVQWAALGLGFLYLMFMFYSYVLQTPISGTAGGTAVNLGSVDEETAGGPAQRLNQAMNSSEPVTIVTQPFADKFTDSLDNSRQKYANLTLPGNWLFSQTQQLDNTASAKSPTANLPGTLVALPQPPAPEVVDVISGRSTVIVPPPPPDAVANGAPPAAPAVQPVAENQDKNWATSQYKLSMSQLATAFRNARLPQNQNLQTAFLRVELEREELMPDGSTWGNRKSIAPLAFNQVPSFPPPGNQGGELQYGQWAEQNQKIILLPDFYQIAKGNPWHLPSEKIEEVQRTFNPADPNMIPQNDTERLAKKKYQDEQNRKNRTTPGAKPGSPARGGGRDAVFAPRETDGPVLLAQLEGSGRDGRGRGGFPGEGLDLPRGGFPGAQPGSASSNEALNKLRTDVPAAAFNPLDAKLPDVNIIAHDDSPEAGKTYRYRIRYQIRSPLYGRPDLVKNMATAQQFGIPSQYSEWTKPVTVPTLVNFFLASRGGTSVKFKIYKWQNGSTNGAEQSCSPGDVIGKMDKSVDYTTGWTLVDIHDNYVLLADPNGNTSDASGKPFRREFKSDEADPLNLKLKNEADAAAGPVANAP